jgi:pyridinium-3,5-biscarboxylic acid mononucleotide synthase
VRDPFLEISEALAVEVSESDGGPIARTDPTRRERTGVPEVIYGDSKSDDTLIASCRQLLDRLPRVVVSRIDPDRARFLASTLGADIDIPFQGRTAVLVRDCAPPEPPCGRIAIFTAGSSDLPVAGEAATVAREIGCAVEIIADVGVAGLHRLVQPLRRVMADGVDAIIVAAGMDGALPSVISGLVDVPVIGLPTSVGYGVAAGGHAALNTMLATCSPGMAVVNIDNGVGAGATAALIARRANRRS